MPHVNEIGRLLNLANVPDQGRTLSKTGAEVPTPLAMHMCCLTKCCKGWTECGSP